MKSFRSRVLEPVRNTRGIAMVTAMILLMALVGIVALATMTSVLEKNVNTTQKVSSRALYAADSGVELSRHHLTRFAKTKLDSLVNNWNGTGTVIPSPATFFPAGGISTSHAGDPQFTASTVFAFADTSIGVESQVYDFLYTTTVQGIYKDSRKTVISEGRIRVSATRGSFADYLMFTDTHAMPNGSPIWFHTSGNFDGRVHTNDQFRFAYFPTFEDNVTSSGDKAWFYNDGSNLELDADANGTTDVPNFYGGFDRGVDPIQLPDNSFNQERAAIGGDPSNASPVTNAEIRAALGLPADTTPPPNGVYIPNNGTSVEGGIYVAGGRSS